MATVVLLLLPNSAGGDASQTILFELIPWLIVGVFLAGGCLALYLCARSTERYRMIGRIIDEGTAERPGTDLDEGRGYSVVAPQRRRRDNGTRTSTRKE